jgi:hypothetical protein
MSDSRNRSDGADSQTVDGVGSQTTDGAEGATTDASDSQPDLSEAVVSIPLEELAELGMEDLYERCTAAGLRDFTELVCSGGGCILHVVTDEPVPADELRELPYVAWWERIRDGGEEPATSIGKLMPAAEPDAIDAPATHGVAPTEHDVTDGRFSVALVGDRSDLADRVREFEAAGASPTIERIGAFDGASAPLDAITERQQTVLRTAHEMGYFEVPREATTAEVADALDLDDSTVAEHLQRAQRSILDDLLGE